ncbi:outer membrane protein assembly factor BamC [Bermanella marisrubri]|uniref:NlpB/DapX lipoprotein n=1 Tax=Bermanella marisrubri TaxID=207949 RepID=Q1N0S4_9GAMM|nr:outer membrane protein assembly factor BamC [Bermanella marisrubri]EAT11759.1 NlpB/DapX lipoprotein [Oceanobacter sp. RED65] [Bermanella marisrubri]QIZ83794.1 outer membrane protein assembly factor BamC [Bermanella marisrubri]
MRNALMLLLLLPMTGCSWLFHDRSNDYLQAEQQPVIQVPKDVARVNLEPQLPIPAVKNKKPLPEEFSVPRPAPLELEDEEDSQASLKQVSSVDIRTELVADGNGTPILRLNIEFARAWSELGEAIKKTDMRITDLNRSIGTYYVDVKNPDKTQEPGFWAGLFGADPEAVNESYEIKLNRARSGVYIAIHESQDVLAAEASARGLLKRIQDKL